MSDFSEAVTSTSFGVGCIVGIAITQLDFE